MNSDPASTPPTQQSRDLSPKPGKTLNLFVDAHVFDDEFQGTRTFLREIYALLAKKTDLRLFLAAGDTKNLEKYFPRQDNIRFLSYKSGSSLVRLGWEIPSLLKKHAIDYAHFQYITPLTKRSKYIVTIHDVIFSEYPEEFSLPYRWSKRFLYGRSARMADIVTTVSAYSKKSIGKFLGIDPGSVHVVPNGVGPKFFEPYDKLRSKDFVAGKYGPRHFVLYVSRIEPRKNHILLLRAWLELELYKKGIWLVLLGHQSIPIPDFDKVLNDLPAEISRLIYRDDRVGDDDLLEFYRAADVFVYPSKAEGFGIPPLEAGALKIPVICSNTSAMEQFSFFGENHIDPFDFPSFTARLSANLVSPPAEEELARLSGLIHREYSWERAAEALYKILPLQK
ncbi:MAG: glycosyltransferase family 1 protein [Puia sp.]|nr:glycosyltransferase family 1 protein [Puia sp.]